MTVMNKASFHLRQLQIRDRTGPEHVAVSGATSLRWPWAQTLMFDGGIAGPATYPILDRPGDRWPATPFYLTLGTRV